MIIGLHGRKKSGKDSVARMLTSRHYVRGLQPHIVDIRHVVPTSVPNELWATDGVLPSVQLSFADPIKVIAHQLYDWDIQTLWGPSELREIPDERYPRGDGSYLTPRLFLQIEGTEVARACYPGTWTDKTFNLADELVRDGFARHITIADLRFDNEAVIVRNRGGHVLEIVNSRLPPSSDLHESEAGINPSHVSVRIINDDTFEVLRARVFAALEGFGVKL
mgnify:CR=1 FL=1